MKKLFAVIVCLLVGFSTFAEQRFTNKNYDATIEYVTLDEEVADSLETAHNYITILRSNFDEHYITNYTRGTKSLISIIDELYYAEYDLKPKEFVLVGITYYNENYLVFSYNDPDNGPIYWLYECIER